MVKRSRWWGFSSSSTRAIAKSSNEIRLLRWASVIRSSLPSRKFARTLARLKESSGAEIGPINAALVQIPKHLDVSVDNGDPFLRKVSGGAQRDTRCDLVVAANVANGVWVFDATGSQAERLILNGNHGYGLHVQRTAAAVLATDRVQASGIYGIWAQTSEGTRVLDDNVAGSRLAGIYVGCSGTGNLQNVSCGRPSDKSLVMQNTLVSNGDYGIAVADESLGNTFRTNHATGDKANDLQDENFHCTGLTGTNQWQTDTGTRNQSVSPTCIR